MVWCSRYRRGFGLFRNWLILFRWEDWFWGSWHISGFLLGNQALGCHRGCRGGSTTIRLIPITLLGPWGRWGNRGLFRGVTQNSIFRQSQPLDLNDTITEADSDGPAGFAEAAQQTYAHNLDDHSSSHVYKLYQTNITTISHTFQGIAARIVAWEENFFDSHCRSSRSDFHDIDHNFDLDPDHNLENFDHCNDHGTVDHSDLPYRIDPPWSIGRLAHNDLHVRTDLLCHTGPLDVGYHICEYWL